MAEQQVFNNPYPRKYVLKNDIIEALNDMQKFIAFTYDNKGNIYYKKPGSMYTRLIDYVFM